MNSKYENYSLKDLTLEYFQMDITIEKMNTIKSNYDKEITLQYDLRKDIYNLIKLRQKEEIENEEKKKQEIEELHKLMKEKARLRRRAKVLKQQELIKEKQLSESKLDEICNLAIQN
jgi:hypothetical protein